MASAAVMLRFFFLTQMCITRQISFGVAPAMCAFCLGLRTPADTLVLTGFVCAGIARLARFNATVALLPKDASGKSKYFEGLPIPSSLLLVGAMAVLVSFSSSFVPYVIPAVAFPFIMLFGHTFIFGHLARLEPTGRAVAATPAMIMAGSTIAPLLGGALVQTIGYPALGVTALVIDLIAVGFFAASRRPVSAVRPLVQHQVQQT